MSIHLRTDRHVAVSEGVEFVFVLPGSDQRAGLDLVQRLRASGSWLLVRTVDCSTPTWPGGGLPARW